MELLKSGLGIYLISFFIVSFIFLRIAQNNFGESIVASVFIAIKKSNIIRTVSMMIFVYSLVFFLCFICVNNNLLTCCGISVRRIVNSIRIFIIMFLWISAPNIFLISTGKRKPLLLNFIVFNAGDLDFIFGVIYRIIFFLFPVALFYLIK